MWTFSLVVFFVAYVKAMESLKQMLSLQLVHLFRNDTAIKDSSFFNLCVVKWGVITLDTKECENNMFIMSLHAAATQRTETLLWAVK